MSNEVITLQRTEMEFKQVYLNLIKPFYLVIGDKDLRIARSVLNKFDSDYHEVIDVLYDQYDITVIFSTGTSTARRKELLLESVSRLRTAYYEELGEVAKRMIEFALKDIWAKVLPEEDY